MDWETLEPGESLNGTYGSREGFTGGQDLTSLGVEVLGARVYDPGYGRWLSPDPAGASASPYVYAGDDPETLIDPTGEWSLSGVLGVVAAVAGVTLAGCGGWLLALYELGSTATVAAGAAGGFSGGFVGGMIGSDGNPEVGFEDGLFGAASGAAMGAIGGIGEGLGGAVERGALEGLVNGTLSAAAGGSFRSGFIGGMVGRSDFTRWEGSTPG